MPRYDNALQVLYISSFTKKNLVNGLWMPNCSIDQDNPLLYDSRIQKSNRGTYGIWDLTRTESFNKLEKMVCKIQLNLDIKVVQNKQLPSD